MNHHSLDASALKGTKPATLHFFRDIFNLQINPQIRLVRAIALHSLVKGNVTEGRSGNPFVLAVLLEHRHQYIFQSGQHVILARKGHFHIHLVELTGCPVCTGILIPEAGRNLEILIKAGGHQQLLKLLGRLGQRIEFAGVISGRHQIVPGAFGGRCGQNGGGNFQKSLFCHEPPQLGNHLAAQDDIALYRRIPQIQEAVLQSNVLICILTLVDLKGQLIIAALSENLDFLGNHLDLAGGNLGVFAFPLPDSAGNGNGGFLIDALNGLHHLLGINYHLGSSVVIPQNQKCKVCADFPDVLQPADDGNLFSCIAKPQLAAVMSSGLGHGVIPSCSCNLCSVFSHKISKKSMYDLCVLEVKFPFSRKKSRFQENQFRIFHKFLGSQTFFMYIL